MTIGLFAVGRALWWFLVGWMCNGGFWRIGMAVFRRTSLRAYLRGELEILKMPWRIYL